MKTQDIIDILCAAYPEQDYFCGIEVGNSTGSQLKRYCDFMAVSAYPSQGFRTIGFEIKVSMSDLKHELTNPKKAEEGVWKFCHQWYLIVPETLAKEIKEKIELPIGWGLKSCNPETKRIKNVIMAQTKEPEKLTTGFLVAFSRSRNRHFDFLQNKRSKDAYESGFEEGKRASDNLNVFKILEKVELIKKETGIDLMSWKPAQEIIEDLNSIRKCRKVTENAKYIIEKAKCITSAVDEIKSLLN
jgi:hypothetical protein